jgi:hypothetical protein
MSSVLFDRVATLIIDQLKIESETLTFEFEVPFDDDTDPNESTIKIYNLKDDTINRIKKNQRVTINAGYKGDVGVILSGYVSKKVTDKSGLDRVTTINVLDSAAPDSKKTIKRSYKKDIRASQIIRDLAALLGLKIAVLALPNDRRYKKGYVINGEVLAELKNIAKDCGAVVYINKSQTYIRSIKAGDDTRFILKSETGLIGSPSPFEEEQDGKTISGYSLDSLLQHRLTTASIVRLESKTVKGTFRVRGGTHKWTGNDFKTTMEVI